MIGNTKGWVLAAVIVVAEVGVVAYGLSLDRTSPPTTIATAPGALDPIALPVDPRTIVKADQPGDAGASYRKAAEAYLADASLYENFIRDRDRTQIPKLIAVDALLAATHLTGDKIFADAPDAVVVYGESLPVQALKQSGIAAINTGLLLEKREAERAKTYYEAAFSLGMRMFGERLTYREMTAGIELMSTAGACLAAQATKLNRADEAAAITKFTDAQRDYTRDHLVPIFEAIYTMNEGKIALHNGDVFAFAKDSRERMWRVEAILKFGRMRYNVGDPGSPGDQRHAVRLATRFAETDPDPIVRRAATVARDLTVEQFRTLH